jgi:hypothetical protein
MRGAGRIFLVLAAVLPLTLGATAQNSDPAAPALAVASTAAAAAPSATAAVPAAATTAGALQGEAAMQALLAFRESEVRFRVSDLMEILRDRRHEGWVLSAYPDPKTRRPLIGAGFSLDLPERTHLQRDPLNPHPFLEPSSAELWQAAGLDPARLTKILDEYQAHLAAWGPRRYRRNLAGLVPEITNDDSDKLLRIAIIQAIENARAYCRDFDTLTGPQQMAMTQLVYQMGVNLEEFDRFLALINHEPLPEDAAAGLSAAAPVTTTAAAAAVSAAETAPGVAAVDSDLQHWEAVQTALEQSQWARTYRTRAVAVIAMLDPHYAESPAQAEQRIAAILRPAVTHRRRRRTSPALQMASTGRPLRSPVRRTPVPHGRRKA